MKLLDYACHACKTMVRDVFDDEDPPRCSSCRVVMISVLTSPPSVDSHSPFKVLSLGGPSFSSYREMEKYAKKKGQIVMTKEEQQRRPSPPTMAEQLAKNKPEKIAAFQKAKYRLKHGYKDFPNLPTEKELKSS